MENIVSDGERPISETRGESIPDVSVQKQRLALLERLFGSVEDDRGTANDGYGSRVRRLAFQFGATIRALFITRPPSLVIFTPLAVAGTLFMGARS